MIVTLQRVRKASVQIDERTYASIGKGLVLLAGIGQGDSESDIEPMIEKIINLRVFENDENKFDKSLIDIGGEVIIISQ